MKRIYIIFGILGGLVPAAYVYSRIYANGLHSEPDMLLFSMGIGIIVTPVFMCMGLIIARMVGMGLGFLWSPKRGARHIPEWPEDQPGNGASWVTRRLRDYSTKKSHSDTGDTERTVANGLSNGTRQP